MPGAAPRRDRALRYRRARPDGGEIVLREGEQEAIREIIRLRLKERQPLRHIVEAMAAKGHRISHQSVVNIVKAQAVS